MKMPVLSPRDRRAVRIAAVALGVLALWVVVSPYMAAVRDVAARLDAERELLARERGAITAAARYRQEAQEGATELMEVATRLFGGGAKEVAAASFAQYLRGVAEECRAFLRRVELGAAGAADSGIIALPVRVTGESDLEGILAMLHALEFGSRLVHVDSLRIHPSRGGSVVTESDEPEVLEFEFTANGYMLALKPHSVVESPGS